ncbi:MAG: nitroreductase family protein [Bacteroidales bacterium]|nr:nitroreductase family protein [Bacteroidales bacterium]
MESLENRKTIRKYKPEKIDESLLAEMIALASRTSTTGNMQLYSVVVSTDEADKKALAPFHFNQSSVTSAPAVLTICADFNRFVKWCENREAVPGYNNFISFVTAAIDALIFAQTFSMVAEERGLGICYLGTTTYNAQEIIDFLKLPKLVIPITTLTLGYPAEQPSLTDRLPVGAILHKGYYHDYTAADIDAFYRMKENLEENKQFIEENGKNTLAQVFTDVRYKKNDNEFFSERFLEVLRKQGFMK